MSKFVLTMCDLLEKGENVVMATVARTPGQALLAGARMLVCADGIFHGTIGGGLLEKEALTIAAEMLASGSPGVRILEFTGEAVTNMQTPCGKGVTVFVEYIEAVPANVRTYRRLLDALHGRVKCCLITTVSTDTARRRLAQRALMCEDGSTLGELSCTDKSLPVLLEKARSVTSPSLQYFGEQRFFIDPWIVPSTVYLFGAGHVAREVAELTGRAGFRTIVLDDREKLARPDRFPLADEVVVLNSFENCFNGLEIPADSYVLVLARERRFEKVVVCQALATKAGYIGIIGSIRKRDALFRELMDIGFSVDDLLRMYCPVGINILAKTPAEIAISIVAELILVRSRKMAAQNSQSHRFPEIEAVPMQTGSAGTGGRENCRTGRSRDVQMGE
jgi:xanthine dehydrogenase accessory factor